MNEVKAWPDVSPRCRLPAGGVAPRLQKEISFGDVGAMAADIADQLPGIEFDPRVCGGSARIAGTRIPVWSLESWRRLGASEEEILRNYPSLRAADLLNAWRYVARHGQEIDREIDENRTATT